MTSEELDAFQRKYPFKHTANAAIDDRSDLSDWAYGRIPLSALMANIAKRNHWRDVPDSEQFTAYIATLGYRRHE